MMTMANCKICGKPVRCANVFHSACWETAAGKTIQTFCDDYCRWPREGVPMRRNWRNSTVTAARW